LEISRCKDFLGHFFPCVIIFDAYLEKNQTFFEIFGTDLIFAMFLFNDKKVQGLQKQVGGPHSARGPHFGHPWFRSLIHRVPRGVAKY